MRSLTSIMFLVMLSKPITAEELKPVKLDDLTVGSSGSSITTYNKKAVVTAPAKVVKIIDQDTVIITTIAPAQAIQMILKTPTKDILDGQWCYLDFPFIAVETGKNGSQKLLVIRASDSDKRPKFRN